MLGDFRGEKDDFNLIYKYIKYLMSEFAVETI